MAEERGCEHSCGLGRREFLGAAALAALALLETACGDGQIGLTAPANSEQEDDGGGTTPVTTASSLVVNLASFPALANVNGVARVDGGQGRPVALVRTSTTTFAAFSLQCPHQGSTVGVFSGGFVCPNHGARFALSGTWTGGQRTNNLRSLVNTFDAVKGTVVVSR